MPTEIVRSQTPEEEELARKLAELATLEMELADRELDLATILGELHLFERRYLHAVGRRYAELDELRAQIAEASARKAADDPQAREDATEARARAQESAQTASEAPEEPAETRFEPSESLKKLYRSAAKAVHPDLATNEGERARRTSLMIEVNRAYEEGDEARLQAIIREWETSPEAVGGEGPGVELVRTIRKIAQVQARLSDIGMEVHRLENSEMAVLKSRVEAAKTDGRDLLTQMTEALDIQIANLRGELATIKREVAGT